MRIIYITAGHSAKSGQDNGAVTQYGNEGKEARKLVTALTKELLDKYKIVVYTDSDDWSLVQTIAWLGSKVKNVDYTIDIHFNASSFLQPTGTEVLIANVSNQKEKNLATKLAECISSTLSIKNRGVKTESDSQHSKLGILSNSKLSSANNLLVEMCFISNPSDMASYNSRFNQLITNLAKTINENIT